MKRRDFMASTTMCIAGTSVLGLAACATSQASPNLLWITCEDMSPVLGCYGDAAAYTPNIDKLAAEGVRYTRAFATAPLCTPARSSLITGLFASTLGTQHLRGIMPLSPSLKGYPQYLRESGYYCTNNVKEDYNFETPDSFWDESSEQAHWRNRPQGTPFFSVFNLMTTHQSRTRYGPDELDAVTKKLSPAERHHPDGIPLPPYYPDTPVVRANVAAFYTQVTLMDKQVGEILNELQADGLADDSIVFFYSDHGSGLPRGKRWLHESGILVPLIIRFPEKYTHLAPAAPGSAQGRLVSFVDFPTSVLSLAGIRPPDHMHGRSFLGPYEAEQRSEIYAIRDRVDEVLDFSRTVHDGRYQYVRNFFPHRPRMQRSFFSESTPIRQEIRRLAEQGELAGDAAWLMAQSKPIEELYDVENDPWEMHNLAARPEHAPRVANMQKKLYAWMLQTRDLSLLHENDMIERAGGRMPYEIAGDDSIYPMERILRIADLVGRGPAHIPALKGALKDGDPTVRYWAATALAALREQATPAKDELLEALADAKSWVRFAAAEACCYTGNTEEACRVLAAGLHLSNVRENLHAAGILVAIDEKSRSVLPEMKDAIARAEGLEDHGWYMREALTYLVGKLAKS